MASSGARCSASRAIAAAAAAATTTTACIVLLLSIAVTSCYAVVTVSSRAENGYVVAPLLYVVGQRSRIVDAKLRRYFDVTPSGDVVVNGRLAPLGGRLVVLNIENRLASSRWMSTLAVAVQEEEEEEDAGQAKADADSTFSRRLRRDIWPPLSARVSETATPGTVVASIIPPQADSNYRFNVSRSAVAASTPFAVDYYNGSIYLTSPVSFDDGPAQYLFSVDVRNDVQSTLDQVVVNVTISPVNNKPPFFTMRPPSQPYRASVSYFAPAGASVLQLSASDRDLGSSIEFGIASGNEAGIFAMSDSGLLKTSSRRRLLPDGAQYLLGVYARDVNTVSGVPTASAQVLVTVGMLPPQFDADVYFPIVPENADSGYVAQEIRVKSFQSSQVTLTMSDVSPPPPQPLFRLNVASGNRATLVTLRQPNLLYGSDSLQYQLTVTAVETDTYLSSSVQVNVTILPENPSSPDFGTTMIVLPAAFDADVAVGTLIATVYAYDPDLGDNGRLTYSLSWIPGVPLPFTITTVPAASSGPGFRYAGVIRVSGPLDYNAVRSTGGYDLQITATDHGNVSRSGSTNVTIALNRVDMSTPVFPTGATALIEYNKPVGSMVTVVQAFDADGDSLSYQFVVAGGQQSSSPPFNIDVSTGVITLSNPLNTQTYSSRKSFTLTVAATSRGSCCTPIVRPPRTGTGVVTVLVVGVNNQPVIAFCTSYNPKIREKTAGLSVIQVVATDNDNGPNGALSYYIVPQGAYDYFVIDSASGMVTTKNQGIDRDTGPTNQLQLTVEARDNGSVPLSAFCTFTVQILDVNDNKPVMNLPSAINVGSSSGNASTLYYLYAEDRDTGSNAQVTYKITKNSADMRFYISSSRLMSYYDLTPGNSYTIEITAQDQGSPPQSSAQQLVIRVVAAPRAPAFVSPPSGSPPFTVDETAPSDFLVMSARATTANDSVTYSLLPSANEIFYDLRLNQSCVSSNSFCLAVYASGVMDAGKKTDYTARIRATPQTGDSSSDISEAFIAIKVRDVNDKVPKFVNLDSNGDFVVSYPENTQLLPTYPLAKLLALDADPTPLFQTANYRLTGGADVQLFSANASGVLTVSSAQTFDRETRDTYSITAAALDGAPSARPAATGINTPNMGEVPVRVMVIDANDNPPFFSQSVYFGQVLESESIGSSVMRVVAGDYDISNNWAYALTSGNTNEAFAVDQSGVITVHSYLDFEARLQSQLPGYYYMQLTASDGVATAQTFVNITLTPVNMHAPVFRKAVYFGRAVDKVQYSITNTNMLTTVAADDADVHRPTSISYDLQGPLANKFIIDSTSGQIWLKAPLARDGPGGRLTWNVTVTAADEPNPFTKIGYAVLCVVLDDVNDQSPVFDRNSLVGSVPELASVGQSVMSVIAYDPDAGPNGTVTYQILPGSITGYATSTGVTTAFPSQADPLFAISSNGQITTNTANLNRDVVDRYTLTVVASDQGSPLLSTTATATIKVADSNNHAPQFSQPCWVRIIPEGTGIGDTVVVVSASDLDPSDTVVYGLVASNANFAVNSSTGAVSISSPLIYSYSGLNAYSIWLTASDGLHTVTACLNATVIASTTAPVFDKPLSYVTLPENCSVGYAVTQLHAAERNVNSARSTQLQYLIDRVSDPGRYFTVDSSSGLVSTARPLDRESQSSYSLSILAVVSGLPPGPATATAVVQVTVMDVPDEAPMLNVSIVYVPELQSNAYSDPPILYAYDPDSTGSPPFTMTAYGSSANDADFVFIFDSNLDVDPVTGVPRGAGRIQTARALKREDGPERTFQLLLTDATGTSAVRKLTIIVSDIDNNPPTAATSSILVYNYMGWQFDGTYQLTQLGICYAADPDDWDAPHKTFGAVGNWPAAFSIHPTTGVISADLSRVQPDSTVSLQCTVSDRYLDLTCGETCRKAVTVTSTVNIQVKTIPSDPVLTGGSVRLKGSTAEQFLKPSAGGQPSKYDLFKKQLADALGTAVANVDVFTVRDAAVTRPGAAAGVSSAGGDNYVDIRYTAHGSPYYNQSKLNAAVIQNLAAISRQIGVEVAQSPVDECTLEGCPGGCTNQLVVGTLPLLITANGSSLVGVDSFYRAVCGGSTAAAEWQPQSCDGPDACLNGGTCTVNDASLSVSCACPAGFDGPRCQQTTHSFSDNSWAWYPSLAQRSSSVTSIEVLTTVGNALVFYNGPFKDPGTDPLAVRDFIALTLESGQPTVYIDQGTGAATASVPVNVADGKWHKIEILRTLREIRIVVDSCSSAAPSASDPSVYDRSGCESAFTTPFENMYINVYNPLEMGGRSDGSAAYWPPALVSKAAAKGSFIGCVRNFIHLGKLYDLRTGTSTGMQKNTNDGCSQTVATCGTGIGGAAPTPCGSNSTCIASVGGKWQCSCLPQWYGDKCDIPTPFLDFDALGYVQWSLTDSLLNVLSRNPNYFRLQITFRSRDPDGNGWLLTTSDASDALYMRLELAGGLLQLLYSRGGNSVGPAFASLRISEVVVTDGQLHTALVVRIGKRVQLSLDGYAYSADNGAPYYTPEVYFVGANTTAGSRDAAILVAAAAGSAGSSYSVPAAIQRSMLDETCVTDVRINDLWLPTTAQSDGVSPVSAAASVAARRNVIDNCTSAACQDDPCNDTFVCVDLWRQALCTCPAGRVLQQQTCSATLLCSVRNPCQNGGTCVSGVCTCAANANGVLWQGTFCEVSPPQAVVALSSDAVAAIVAVPVGLILILIVALVVLSLLRQRRLQKGESEYDPSDDIRETIVHYDEEGVPEEDQDAFDIGRLGKIQPGDAFDDSPWLSGAAPVQADLLGSGASPPPFLDAREPAHPDVGDFISQRLDDADNDPSAPVTDATCEYAYEGGGSVAGSLSSLDSTGGSSDASQDFDYLNELGPPFRRLADLYTGSGPAGPH